MRAMTAVAIGENLDLHPEALKLMPWREAFCLEGQLKTMGMFKWEEAS